MANREKRKELITEARTQQILDAALSVFTSKGFGQATIADIADEAGIGVGTIYNYYKDKHDLLISLLTRTLFSTELSSILGNISTPGSTPDNREFMQSLLEDRLGFMLENAQRFLFLFFEVQRDARLRKQYVNQVVSPILHTLENYIRMQACQGHFRKVDEPVIARTLVATMIGNAILYGLELKDSPLKKTRRKDIARELTDFFLQGIVNK